MAELRAGNIPAVMGPIGELEVGLSDGLAIHTPPLPGLARDSWTLGVAVRHNWRPLSYAIDDILVAAVNDGKIEEIFKQHGLRYAPPEL
jgi:ABC-type amino acid transport substrate-binding protein